MKQILFVCAAILLVTLNATPLKAGETRSDLSAADTLCPTFSRGMNLHHLLNWPDTKPGEGKTEYVWPPFETKEYQIGGDELARLKSMGFDYLRVTADPSIFLASEPARREQLIGRARRTVTRLIGAGFRVIFDLHPVSVNPDYAPLKLVESIDSPAFKAYADLMEEVARSLHDLPHDRVAFELMNEPWLDSAEEIARWQPMLERLHSRARRGSPTLPLVLTGAQWGSPSALMKLDTKPFAGSNVLYTIHYYDPHTYTHQGVESDEGAYLSGLQWPASHVNTVTVLDAACVRIDAARKPPAEQKQLKDMMRKLLSDYELSAHDAQRIRTDFEAVATWAAKAGIPAQRIFLGEFGCVSSPHHTPLGEDRTTWLRTVHDAAHASGFGWALWAYKGYGGMALFDEAGNADDGIVKALELKK